MSTTSTAPTKGRAERPDNPRAERSAKPSLRTLVQNLSIQNLVVRVRLWLEKLASLAYARVAMIFVAGFAAGIVWDSYNGTARRAIASWTPYLGWVAPPTSYERFRSMELDLSTARQSLSKLSNEMNKLEAQGLDTPRRRSVR